MTGVTSDDVHALADGIQQQMPGAWLEVKGSSFPGNPADPDQKVLFLAIARGLLTYLVGKSNLIATLTSTQGGVSTTETVTGVTYNLTDSSGPL